MIHQSLHQLVTQNHMTTTLSGVRKAVFLKYHKEALFHLILHRIAEETKCLWGKYQHRGLRSNKKCILYLK